MTETVFKLVDAINAKDAAWVFRILSDLYDQRKQPYEILGYLGWFIKIMQKIVLLTEKGVGPEGISRELGYSPAYTRRLIGQSKKYPVSNINRWIDLLIETDSDIKTGRKEADMAMEMLLVSLIEI